MQCSFNETIEHSDGTSTTTWCYNTAQILTITDPCYGLCWLCAYTKTKAELESLKEESVK